MTPIAVLFFVLLLLTVGVSIGYFMAAAAFAKAQKLAQAQPNVPRRKRTKGKQAPAAAVAPSPEKFRKTPKLLVLYGLSGILVLLGLLDLIPAIDFEAYSGSFLLMGITALLEFGVFQLSLLRKSRTVRFFGKLLLAATVLELTIMQMPSYHLLLGDYPQKSLSPVNAQVEAGDTQLDNESGTILITGKDECVLTFTSPEVPVGTVYVQTRFTGDAERYQLVLDAGDATHLDYRYDVAKSELVRGRDNTNYISCQLSGEVTKLRVKFTGKNDTDQLVVQNIQLNKQIPFCVSPLRMFLILFLGTAAYAIVCSAVLARPYENAKRFCGRSAAVMTACAMVLAVVIVVHELPSGGIAKQLRLSTGNQITQELVDAFEDGHLYLNLEPSQELMAMENPYDWSERSRQDIDAEWDHVYYEGKYYSYYGIAPVVLFFLPWHLVTGHYASTNLSVLLFCLVGMLFLTLTYLAAAKRWFRRVPSGCVLAGLAVLLTACGIWYSVGRTLFYEISISSGFAFVTIGAYCLITANVIGEGKLRLPRTALASLFFGLAVLCRPTLAVYAICAVVFFLLALPRAAQLPDADGGTVLQPRRRILYLICAGLPLLLLGIVQMWYNAARFGSPFDFGIQYSLTINDFTHSQYHTSFVLICLWNYLFAPFLISPEYPYLSTPFSKMNVNGYFFSDIGNTSGIFFLALPVLAYVLCSRRAVCSLPNRTAKWKSLLYVGLPCVIMPLVIICSVWESGYAVRYVADFSWEMILGALLILFYLYQNSRSIPKKRALKQFMALSMVWAVVANGIQIFHFSFPPEQYAVLSDHLTQLIAFWK